MVWFLVSVSIGIDLVSFPTLVEFVSFEFFGCSNSGDSGSEDSVSDELKIGSVSFEMVAYSDSEDSDELKIGSVSFEMDAYSDSEDLGSVDSCSDGVKTGSSVVVSSDSTTSEKMKIYLNFLLTESVLASKKINFVLSKNLKTFLKQILVTFICKQK